LVAGQDAHDHELGRLDNGMFGRPFSFPPHHLEGFHALLYADFNEVTADWHSAGGYIQCWFRPK
jgi:hypothetical protein